MARRPALQRVLRVLRSRSGELRHRGVKHAAVFGSVARGDSATSDVDILVTLDPAAKLDAFSYAGIIADIQDWVGRRVDLARRDKLKAHVKPRALKEAVRAF